jgi:hypothetical protein
MPSKYQTEFDQDYAIGSIIETLGGSGVIQIFVHDVTSLSYIAELAATVPGYEKYPERSIVIARPDDLVCVLSRVDDRYLRFLSSLGVGPKNGNVIVASEKVNQSSDVGLSNLLMNNYHALLKIRKLVKRHKKIILNPYIALPQEFKLATILEMALGRKVHMLGGNSDIVDFADHKHNVKAKALELGVPVSEGDTVELQVDGNGRPLDLTPMQVAINRYIRKTTE